jgi:ribonuclease P/MRP protein subunit RPP40
MRKLYTCYVRPQLEFSAAAWNPYLALLEKVQRRATRVHDTKGLRYPERLRLFKLQTLEDRRRRGYLIQFFKIIHKLDGVSSYHPQTQRHSARVEGPAGNLRGHSLMFSKVGNLKCSARINFLSNRVISDWNGLNELAVRATSVNNLKNQIDKIKSFQIHKA